MQSWRLLSRKLLLSRRQRFSLRRWQSRFAADGLPLDIPRQRRQATLAGKGIGDELRLRLLFLGRIFVFLRPASGRGIRQLGPRPFAPLRRGQVLLRRQRQMLAEDGLVTGHVRDFRTQIDGLRSGGKFERLLPHDAGRGYDAVLRRQLHRDPIFVATGHILVFNLQRCRIQCRIRYGPRQFR